MGCEALMDAHHDKGQKEPPKKARHGAAPLHRFRGAPANGSAKSRHWLQNVERQKRHNKDDKGRRHKKVKGRRHDFPQLLFPVGRKEGNEEDGKDAAPAWRQGHAVKGEVGKAGMGNEGSQDAANNGRTAKDLGRVPTDEDIHGLEDGASR